jgi:hypothetical protein
MNLFRTHSMQQSISYCQNLRRSGEGRTLLSAREDIQLTPLRHFFPISRQTVRNLGQLYVLFDGFFLIQSKSTSEMADRN